MCIGKTMTLLQSSDTVVSGTAPKVSAGRKWKTKETGLQAALGLGTELGAV